jgi:hypothetical protein
MFNDNDFQIALNPVSEDAKLVLIQIDETHGILAVAKPFGNGKASCIAFSPATTLERPFDGYRPQFLRKTITNDFALRAGTWKAVPLDNNQAVALRQAAAKALEACEKTDPAVLETIDMNRVANTSSAPDLAFATYIAPEHTPFEAAVIHLMGIKSTQVGSHAQQENGEASA